jgi:hypothetical protein
MSECPERDVVESVRGRGKRVIEGRVFRLEASALGVEAAATVVISSVLECVIRRTAALFADADRDVLGCWRRRIASCGDSGLECERRGGPRRGRTAIPVVKGTVLGGIGGGSRRGARDVLQRSLDELSEGRV